MAKIKKDQNGAAGSASPMKSRARHADPAESAARPSPAEARARAAASSGARRGAGAAAGSSSSSFDATLTPVERAALERSGYDRLAYGPEERVATLVVPNFPALGRLAAGRFLEWVQENPEGAVSLPTGKTPEHFIKFVTRWLSSWEAPDTQRELGELGLATARRPTLAGLRFVQIDEFYPIDTRQHNSFFYYVNKYYLKGFGMDPARALLIDPSKIGMGAGERFRQVFPQATVDLSLRIRQPKTQLERRQAEILKAADEFSIGYETAIREMGGLGFFLGGIGPDGHIAFNVRGSDLYSTTRLAEANYETKAASASDLGGVEVSRHKHVLTIGLATITYNPECVALVIAAGEAKADILARTIESAPSPEYPGSVLQTLPRGRFYLTRGAAVKLRNRRYVDLEREAALGEAETRRIVMDVSLSTGRPVRQLSREDLAADRFGGLLLAKSGGDAAAIVTQVEQAILDCLHRGSEPIENTSFLHTSPHHDDIILGYLPYFNNAVRSNSNRHDFAYLTSGFTAVTNSYMAGAATDLLARVRSRQFDALLASGYFDPSSADARHSDAAHFLRGSARLDEEQMEEGVARRFLRNLMEVYEDDSPNNLMQRLEELENYFQTQYPGKKDIPIVQQLKGRMREFESDAKWAYYGFRGESVHHLRLGFYQGDIFTEAPTVSRDAAPVLRLLEQVRPDVVTVAFDPEGSGPDTHYKTLQAVSAALKLYEERGGKKDLRVVGYRNVWFRYHPSEANVYIPTTLSHLNDMEACFMTCFTTQKAASFPSYELDGPFSHLARRVQVSQFDHLRAFLGEEFFLKNPDYQIRASCAAVYLKEMTLTEFHTHSEQLKAVSE